jgi:hypothetical protein
MRSFFATVLGLAVMLCIVPLWIWGASGSWRHAMHAARQYWAILAVLVAVGGGLGLLMAFSGAVQ